MCDLYRRVSDKYFKNRRAAFGGDKRKINFPLTLQPHSLDILIVKYSLTYWEEMWQIRQSMI